MTEELYLDLDTLKKIPENLYPFMVFSDNVRGIFSLGVKIRTHGSYGHFMWLIAPNSLASQSLYYKLCTLDQYKNCNIKLVYNPNWTEEQKSLLITSILKDLNKPWYKTLYDIPGIFGELFGWDWLNLPKLNFCSERGDCLKLVDPEYDLKNPDPSELNKWTKNRKDRYKVFGRYTPD